MAIFAFLYYSSPRECDKDVCVPVFAIGILQPHVALEGTNEMAGIGGEGENVRDVKGQSSRN